MIAYKVVDKEYRLGSNALLYIDTNGFELFKRAVQKYQLQLYFPVYKKGAIVKAVEGSIGIMCFFSEDCAKEFIYYYRISRPVIIVKVDGKNLINESVTKKIKLIPGCAGSLARIKHDQRYKYLDNSHDIVTFSEVLVLE